MQARIYMRPHDGINARVCELGKGSHSWISPCYLLLLCIDPVQCLSLGYHQCAFRFQGVELFKQLVKSFHNIGIATCISTTSSSNP